MSLKFLDVINYEGGNDVLVWKHPCEDFNTGSHLIVHESQEALFMCNGQVAEKFGPGRHDLKTENIPVLRRLLNIPTGGVSPFHCEVYYINKSIPMDLKWGTPDQVIAIDPQFHILIHAGANGGMGVQIGDSQKFLVSFNGTNREFTTESLTSYFRETPVVTLLGLGLPLLFLFRRLNRTKSHFDRAGELERQLKQAQQELPEARKALEEAAAARRAVQDARPD